MKPYEAGYELIFDSETRAYRHQACGLFLPFTWSARDEEVARCLTVHTLRCPKAGEPFVRVVIPGERV